MGLFLNPFFIQELAMPSKIRVGVVGTSGWADFMYLSSLRSHPQAELAAICGRTRERAEELADKYAIPQVFTDYAEMIEQAGLDAIVVGSPDDLHHAIALKALQADLHVLCDKPLAYNLQQAHEMYEAAEKSQKKHMVLFTFRWMPFFRYVHDLVQQGWIGRCYHSEFRFVMGYARKPEYQWRLDRQRANGALGDLGVHVIDLARWLVGDIGSVSAQTGVFVERPGADGGPLDPANDLANLIVKFENGAHGMIHASLVSHLGDRFMQQQVKLYGEAGSLEIDVQYQGAEAGVTLYIARDPGDRFQRVEIPAAYWGDVQAADPWGIFSRQPVGCRAFIDAILENRPATPDFLDGYKAQQVIHAALEADRSASWVSI
jgi:predicted dehydrogenase